MLDASVIQQLARQVSVPGAGLTIPVISGEPTADWVAEAAEKPVSRHTLNKLSLTPKKLAVIEPFSDEFRRDLPGLYAELVRRLPNSLGKKFDQEAISGNRTQIGSLYDEGEAAATNADLQTVRRDRHLRRPARRDHEGRDQRLRGRLASPSAPPVRRC